MRKLERSLIRNPVFFQSLRLPLFTKGLRFYPKLRNKLVFHQPSAIFSSILSEFLQNHVKKDLCPTPMSRTEVFIFAYPPNRSTYPLFPPPLWLKKKSDMPINPLPYHITIHSSLLTPLPYMTEASIRLG